MESGGFIIKFFEHKTLLITGSTGFLASIFVEKLLRVQPQVKKLYLLLRAEDNASATKKMRNVIGKQIFRVLKEEHGHGFDIFISDKVTAVAGDISLDNLGIQDFALLEKMSKEINFVVNVAGTTNFDERYDVALGTNTMGAKYVCEFAMICAKLELLLHVSTAYVTREKEGLILEKPLRMGETFNGSSCLNIAEEFNVAQNKLKQLQEEKATDKSIGFAMKELGMQRARLHGWPNTYTFTKAMGEMLLGEMREDQPLAIVRPTIITSTYKDPFPGWIEGFRTIDSYVGVYGKGNLEFFVAAPDSIMDVIPGDIVVNAMMVSMATYRFQPAAVEVIYDVGSSSQNPVNYTKLSILAHQYFSKNPLMKQNGKPIRISKLALLPTMDSFCKYTNLRYKLPLQVLGLMNILSCKSLGNLYNKRSRKLKLLMRFLQLYRHFVFFKAM